MKYIYCEAIKQASFISSHNTYIYHLYSYLKAEILHKMISTFDIRYITKATENTHHVSIKKELILQDYDLSFEQF